MRNFPTTRILNRDGAENLIPLIARYPDSAPPESQIQEGTLWGCPEAGEIHAKNMSVLLTHHYLFLYTER